MKIGVACALYSIEPKFWLSKRLGSYQTGKYAFPGGMLEQTDLSEAHAIQRELLEEAGLNVELNRFKRSITSHHMGGKSDVTQWFLLLLKPEEIPQNLEPNKHEPWHQYTLDEVKKLPLMVSTIEILDLCK